MKYETGILLGQGGMGEVYQAYDPQLARHVALKFLRRDDPILAERLLREARLQAQVEHELVCKVYEVGEVNGRPFIAMQYIEGVTLDQAAREMNLEQKVRVVRDVAEAVHAAHRIGLIHRDLKPSNILVENITGEGWKPHVLDFGLAREHEATGLTETGIALGTPPYMAPEQARGEIHQLDGRTDVYSLGAVLYELLTGRPPFEGKSTVELLIKVIQQKPLPPRKLDVRIPADLEAVALKCLEKEPRRRYDSARALADDLERCLEGEPVEARRESPRYRFGRLWPLLAASALATALAVGFLAGKLVWKTPPPPPPKFHQLTFRRGTIQRARFAPDGQTIVYGAAWEGNPAELFSTRPGGGSPESRSLGLPSAEILDISSSGEMAISLNRRFIYGWVAQGTLARVSLAGGAAREVLADVQEVDWVPDGSTYAAVRRVAGRHHLEFPIGKIVYETAGWVSHARVSPKGDLLAFLDHPRYGDDGGSVAVIDRKGRKRTLSPEWPSTQGLAWSPSGNEIWFSAAEVGVNSALQAVTLSGRRRVVERIAGRLTLQDISRDGRVLLTRDSLRYEMRALAQGEAKERDLSWFDSSEVSDLSSDGKTLLFTEDGEGGGPTYGAYIRGADGSPAVRLGEGLAMSLSPDGRWVLSRLNTSPPQLFLLPTGAGDSKRVEIGPINLMWASFFPDGKRILLLGWEPGRRGRMYVQDLSGGSPRAFTPEGVYGYKAISPDGKRVAARTDQEFAVYSVEGQPPRPMPGLTASDRLICWSNDGRALYFYRSEERPARIYRLDLATQVREVFREWTPADPAGIFQVSSIFMTPDGKLCAYTYGRLLSDLFLVDGLK